MAFNQGSAATTLISRDTEVVGDVGFSGDLEVQGSVRGNITARGEGVSSVRIVEGGRVEGEVHAPHVVVNGAVSGDIYASEHLELAAKAQVDGNIHYKLIEMVKGAQLNGRLLFGDGRAQTVAALHEVPVVAEGGGR
jgi:cytoskeletal protein CcmA (bactofilin family)